MKCAVFLMLFMAAGCVLAGDRAAGLNLCQIHRGGGAKAMPDNTLEAFLWAWGHGTTPEADARLTKDGVAIAFHDNTLARVCSGIPADWGSRKIKDMTWGELKEIDTGSYLGPQYSSVRITTLEAVFAAMKGRPERFLYLDEKGAPPELMAELSAKYGVQQQVYYCSSKAELLPRWKKIAPQSRTMHWMGTWSKANTPEEVARTEKILGAHLDELEKAGFPGIDQIQIHVRTDFSRPDPFCPSSAFLKKAGERIHKAGLKFQTLSWTEGANPKVYQTLWELGCDSFTTDYPVEFFETMKTLK